MSRGLFSFSDPQTIAAHARLLHPAFTRPMEDPNYMPATRDLSAGRVTAILRWLEGYLPEAAIDRRHWPPGEPSCSSIHDRTALRAAFSPDFDPGPAPDPQRARRQRRTRFLTFIADENVRSRGRRSAFLES